MLHAWCHIPSCSKLQGDNFHVNMFFLRAPNFNSPPQNQNVFPSFFPTFCCFATLGHFHTPKPPKSTQFNTKQCGLEESSNQLRWGLITIPNICVSKFATHPVKQMIGRFQHDVCQICWGSKQIPLATCDPQHHNTT